MTRRIATSTRSALAALCVLWGAISCRHSPAAPPGAIQVHITRDTGGAAPGKKVAIEGTTLSGITNASGIVDFEVTARDYVVRAYAIGVPGPGRPFVEQPAAVSPGLTTTVEFFDCTMCAAARPGAADRAR